MARLIFPLLLGTALLNAAVLTTAVLSSRPTVPLPLVDQSKNEDELNALRSRLPKIFLVGFPKCGSTSLSSYLHYFPLLLMPTPHEGDPSYFLKEVHYFDSSKRYAEGLEFYASYYPRLGAQNTSSVQSNLTGVDATPAIINIMYFERMSAVFSQDDDLRFLVTVRDPLDAVHSAWNHLGKINYEMNSGLVFAYSGNFEQDMRRVLFSKNYSSCVPSAEWWSRRSDSSVQTLISRFVDHCPPIIRNYIYVVFLEIWAAHFGRRNFCVFLMEELEDPNAQMLRVARCLRIKSDHKHINSPAHRNRAVSYRSGNDISNEVRRAMAEFNFPWLCELRKMLLTGDFPEMTQARLNNSAWFPSAAQC